MPFLCRTGSISKKGLGQKGITVMFTAGLWDWRVLLSLILAGRRENQSLFSFSRPVSDI